MRFGIAGVLAATMGLAACGGNSAPLTPSSPTSMPLAADAGQACAAIGARSASPMVGIFNGSACSTDGSAVVLLNLRDKSDNPIAGCSGTVIAPRAVLTAAHCLQSNVAMVKIWSGSGLQVVSTDFHRHPAYRDDESSTPDVGVVLTGDNLVEPALPLLWSRDARTGEEAVIAGWGLDENGERTRLKAGITTIRSAGATFLLTYYAPGDTTSGVCSGDSGGPLLLSQGGTWAIGGITSATSSSGCSNSSDYFTNVRNPAVQSFIASLVPQAGSR